MDRLSRFGPPGPQLEILRRLKDVLRRQPPRVVTACFLFFFNGLSTDRRHQSRSVCRFCAHHLPVSEIVGPGEDSLEHYYECPILLASVMHLGWLPDSSNSIFESFLGGNFGPLLVRGLPPPTDDSIRYFARFCDAFYTVYNDIRHHRTHLENDYDLARALRARLTGFV